MPKILKKRKTFALETHKQKSSCTKFFDFMRMDEIAVHVLDMENDAH